MRSIPYGYKIVDGHVEIVEEEAEQVKAAFFLYLTGVSLNKIGEASGIKRNHCGISTLLNDWRYKGTDFYPRIITDEQFDLVKEKRMKEQEKNRKKSPRRKPVPKPSEKFVLKEQNHRIKDPYQQASYLYSQIKEV